MQKLFAGMIALALLGGSGLSRRIQARRAIRLGTIDTRRCRLISNLARLTPQTTP